MSAPEHSPEQNPAAWMQKARRDLERVPRRLSEDPPDVEDALFHAQQSVEKALKAYLTFQRIPFRKTHDLESLARECLTVDPTLASVLETVDDLTGYASAYRYPTHFPEPPEWEGEAAADLARRVYQEVVARLPEEVRAALIKS